MLRIIFVSLLLLFYSIANSQDTIVVMHYNLLNYAAPTAYCDETNNNISGKNSNLRIITDYIKPDILSVNEISKLSSFYSQISDSVLNINGSSDYLRAQYSNGSNSDIINMVYYNKNKLVLHSQERIITSIRDINLYKFYSKMQDFSGNDTVFFTCISAHLKAGSTTADADERGQMTLLLMNHLNTHTSGNYLVMGDFNLYTNTETAFQNLTNYSNSSIRFYDPINKMGSWSDNSNYAICHTQSTHSTSNNCAASGGLDDRFDFILTSYPVLAGLNGVSYIPNSYKAVGQDGLHLNKSLTNGTNNSAPQNIINALYNMSDHLPVVLKLKLDANASDISEKPNDLFSINFFNSELTVFSNNSSFHNWNISIFNIAGQNLYANNTCFSSQNQSITISTKKFVSGIYFVKLNDNFGNLIVKKFFIY
ncbi:MAG: T9SS type A sorting domain-containing protein [Bacteroidota bacterium]